ncbi:MAG: transposase, partial [Chloroflexota bacterium]
TQQAGAEHGYNPKKPGRPSHHPLLAFLVETGDCLGVRWRPGSAWSGAGATDWLPGLVERLRGAGVKEITVRLDKEFFSRDVARCLQRLEVSYLLKVPNHPVVRDQLRSWRHSTRAEGIFEDAATVRTSSGQLWGGRLLSLEGRRPLAEAEEDTLELDTHEVTDTAHILTDREGIHALTAWRAYNRGTAVEHRIKELKQLLVGRTAVDDLEGNALLWQLGVLAYQMLHGVRSLALSGPWRTATPDRLRNWLFRIPGRFTRHARKIYLQLRGNEPLRRRLLQALRRIARLRGPPLAPAG